MPETHTQPTDNRVTVRLPVNTLQNLESFAKHTKTTRNHAARILLTTALTVSGDQSSLSILVSIERSLLDQQELLSNLLLSHEDLKESTATAVYMLAAMQKDQEPVDLDRLQEVINEVFYPQQEPVESS